MKDALKSDNDEQIKSALEKLNEAMQAAATEMYSKVQPEAQAQQQQAGGEQPKGEKQADGDVIDADYKMDDDKKK